MQAWYKSRKLWLTVFAVATTIAGKLVAPDWQPVADKMLAAVLALIVAHTVTDVASVVTKKQ